MLIAYVATVDGSPRGGFKSLAATMEATREKLDSVLLHRGTLAGTVHDVPTIEMPKRGFLANVRGNPIRLAQASAGFIRENVFAWRVLRKLHPDIVHCNDLDAYFGVRLAAAALRIPVVLHVRDIPRRPMVTVAAAKRCAGAVAVSGRVAEALNGSSKDCHVVTVYNPVLSSPDVVRDRKVARSALGLDKLEGPIVGYVAAVEPRKGQLEFIKAAIPALTALGAHVVFMGPRPNREYEVRCRQALSLSERCEEVVTWRGYVPDADKFLAAFDVVALFSTSEGLPRVALEAGRALRPIVITDVGGAREAVVDGATGFVVPAGDAKMFADRVCELVRNADLASRMGAAAEAYVARTFAPSRTVAQLLQLYTAVRSLPPSRCSHL